MMTVKIGTNIPATPIHDELDLLHYFLEVAIAAADNARLEYPWLAHADIGIIITNTECDDEQMMNDEDYLHDL